MRIRRSFDAKVQRVLKPICYASRSLNETEKRYAQIEKEALALTWSCERFRNYLIGLSFQLQTDYKPLVALFDNKNLDELLPRIQRFGMRMMWFHYKVIYIPGKLLSIADAFSRSPICSIITGEDNITAEVEVCANNVVTNFPASDNMLQNIHNVYKLTDPVCSMVIRFSNFPGQLWYRENGKKLTQNRDPEKLPGLLRIIISIFLYVFNYFCNSEYNR